MKVFLLGFSSLILVACGGGDGTPNNPTNTQVSDSLSTKVILNNAINAFDDSIATDQAVELFLYYPSSEVSNITWTQTAGEAVTLLTPNDKGIAFTPNRSGRYSFDVTFTTADSTSQTLTHEINVTDEISSISARLGHVVSEGNKVSLRTSLTDNLSFNSISWQQTSGPEVILTDENTSGKTAIFFNAPPVDQDTFITFEVSASSTNSRYQDTVALLIENKSEISPNAIFDERVSNTFAYNENSPYKNNLVDCVYSNEITVSRICTLNELPLIAHDTLTPTVDDIMDRVVVSHQWMGDRFKAFLEVYDIHDDLKNMLRATTAIVISYDVRPSFYWAATGAIYLDANNFWLSVDERDTLNEAPDFRASFGNDLQFDIPWRYIKDNDYLSTFISEDTRISREVDEGVYSVIGLMYHELAHANDFFPKSSWFNLDRNKQIIAAIPNTIQSDILSQIHPLHGNEMFSLAQVNFSGFTATETEKSFTPQDITQLFSIEAAPQFYNYSSIREDYAMLFDGFMMKARYNIDRDVAITNSVDAGGFASDYIVDWGQRGRISDDKVKPRVAYVVERVLPEFDGFQIILDSLPEPIMMESGKSWIDNLDISPSSAPKSLARAQISSQTIESNRNRPANESNSNFIEKALPTN